jgi:hypothetical protein
MNPHVNTYTGLNQDTAYDSIAPNLYIDALDIRITTTSGESTGAFTNMKGTVESFTIPFDSEEANPSGEPFGVWTASNPKIIGYTTIRNRIIVFVADDSGTKSWIYDIQYNTATREILSGFPALKYYSSLLNFSKDWPIEALGRYESDCTQRVYWTDYNNFFRTINLEDPNLTTLDPGLVDIYPNVEFTQPLLTSVTGGGALMSGEYQVAYRLITFDGKQTLVSPPSNLIHIVSDSELTGSADYNGDPIAINTGKSLSVTVDTSNYSVFDKIEFLVLYYENGIATPSAKSVETMGIGLSTSIVFTYTGSEGSQTTEELFTFATKNFAFKTPKTFTQKDNSLIVANIKGSQVNLASLLGPNETFYAKTRRYRNLAGIITPPFTPGSGNDDNDLQNAFNLALNKDAHWDSNWQTNQQYRYQSDGARLGGEGPNISYTFHLEPMTVDGDVQAGFANVSPVPFGFPRDSHDLNDGYGVRPNTTYPNAASPFISGLLRGYKRGETYRFGIIFYTTKGEATFVEYIGDIKFPDISEEDSVNNASDTPYFPLSQADPDTPQFTIAYNLGIQFSIDFSTCPDLLSNVTGYQIVRVERKDTDKRRLTQGVIRTCQYFRIQEASSDFDLSANGNENVIHLDEYYGNSTFDTLGTKNPVGPALAVNEYLGFYSPEISFNYKNTVNNALGGSTGLLITGGYSVNNFFVDRTETTSDKRPIDLPEHTQDVRIKVKNCNAVTFNSIENIKAWNQKEYFNMLDDSTYQNKITPIWGGYTIRNYYAYNIGNNLNDPDHANFGDSSFSRSGSNILGYTKSYDVDPITQQPVPTVPTTEYFKNEAFGGVTTIGIASNASYPIVDLIVPRAEIYGGYSQDALESTTFITASPIIDTSETTPIVFGGDIFMNMSTLQIKMVDFDTALYKTGTKPWFPLTFSQTELFVTESQINQDLAYGATLRTLVEYTFDGDESPVLRQENNNTKAPTAKDVSNMYAYNLVNSRENIDVAFFVEPTTSSSGCVINDVRGYLSDVKINNEQIDSWTKFGVNNYYDIDDYGPINRVINFKDSIFFIQDRAVGVYAINRAAITTSTDGVPTQLGTGLGFGKHQYYTKEHGSIHQWAVKQTDSGIYFFDAIHRKIFLLGEGNSPLSEIKGMHSFLQNLGAGNYLRKEYGGDNPILNKGVHIGKDLINNEIIFTFLTTGMIRAIERETTYNVSDIVLISSTVNYYVVITSTFTTSDGSPAELILEVLEHANALENFKQVTDFSLVYDELSASFSSRLSQTPPIWIENGDTIITTKKVGNAEKGFVHNIGNYGEFYNNVEECFISLVVNPQADLNKILRTLEYNSIVRDNNKVVDRTQTITAFRIYNEYQDTGKVSYSTDRIKRRFDKWRVKIPRDINNQRARLRSSYFIVNLYFDNSENKELIMNRLISYFDVQMF